MQIKVTVGELTVMGKPLEELMDTVMPSTTAYHAKRLMQKLSGEIYLAIDAQAGIMRKYNANEGDGGLMLARDNPNFAKAEAELNALFQQEVTVDVEPMTLPKKVALKPSILLFLEKFVKVA